MANQIKLTTMYNKQQLIDAVIEDLKKGFAVGDYTVLDELLSFVPDTNLVQALPEEQWKEHNVQEPYFKIVAQGFDEELQREQVEIGIGAGKLFLIKTDEGFITDVYNGEDLIDSMVIYDDEVQQEDFMHTTELCPACDKEVVLDNKFEVQQCPSCGKAILPCSICDHGAELHQHHCNECPLDKVITL